MTDQTGNRSSEGVRPYVVLLFVDLCDSVPLGESMDPEELDLLLQQFEQISLDIVEKHGGNACQLRGDGVLVEFGYPEPLEDDARRAVEAAVELHQAVRDASWPATPRGFEVRLHSAIHAGRVFARQGDALRGRYELLGDTVNTAARLADHAARDEILVSAAALGGIEGLFVTEPAVSIALKGKSQPVEAQRVLGRAEVDSRFDARVRTGLTEFVGREAELELLDRSLSGHGPGTPRIVVLTGAPGIGKTRILRELRQRVERSGHRVLQGTCDAYGSMAPFGPFLQVLRQLFGIQSLDDPDAMVREVEKEVGRLGPDVEAHLEDFLRLLSLLPWKTDSHGQAARVHAAPAFAPLFASLTRSEPVLLLLDDWQWADDASREVLEEIRGLDEAAGLTVVVGAREGELATTTMGEVEWLSMRPFTEAESARMIRRLRPNVLDLGVTRAIHERTGGNPLFVEELCRSLPADALAGERALEESGLSSTLQGVIQARVSALPATQARVIGAASIAGNEFSAALVAHALPDEDVEPALDDLARGDLIHATELAGTFRFRHGITREAIYDSVRLDRARDMHHRIATAIESGAAVPDSSSQLETLAHHYRGCGDHEAAARYAELAGDKALATSSLDRARLQYSTALSELGQLTPTLELKQQWLGVFAKWAGVYVYSGSSQQLGTAKQAKAWALEVGDPVTRARTIHWSAWLHYVLGDYQTAVAEVNEALSIAEHIDGAEQLVAQLAATLGQAHAAGGHRAEALEALARGVQAKRIRPGSTRRTLPMGYAYAVAARASLHAHYGDFEQAHSDMADALDAVGGSGHPIEGSVGALECTVLIYQGDWERLIETAERTAEITARVNSAYTFAMVSVFAATGRGMLDENVMAPQELIQTVDWLEARDTGLYASLNYASIAEAFAAAGEHERSRDFAQRAIQRREKQDLLGESMAYRALARVAHAGGEDPEEARGLLEQSFDAAKRIDCRRDVAVTTLLRAELARAAGAGDAAQQDAAAALEAFESMQMRWHAARAHALLDEPAG